jgi:uncharacterized membrane protein
VRRFVQLLKREMLTGLALLAPIAGTIYLVYYLVSTLDGLFPERWRPHIAGHPLPGFGVVLVFVLTLTVGVVTHNLVGERLTQFIDRFFQRVPIFGGTYGLMKQVFESVFSQKTDSFSQAVLVPYPHPESWAIAFVTSTNVPIRSPEGKELISVFVPTTPNPTSGFYLLVEKETVRPLEMTVQQAFKLVITMGVAREPAFLTTTGRLDRKDLN